jgi:Flp pilus assembly protein TadB
LYTHRDQSRCLGGKNEKRGGEDKKREALTILVVAVVIIVVVWCVAGVWGVSLAVVTLCVFNMVLLIVVMAPGGRVERSSGHLIALLGRRSGTGSRRHEGGWRGGVVAMTEHE